MRDDRLEQLLVESLERTFAGDRAPVPEGGLLVWQWFADLCATRSHDGGVPRPISYAEIEAYGRLTGWPMAWRHIRLISILDRAWLRLASVSHAPSPQPRSKLTPEIFDVVF